MKWELKPFRELTGEEVYALLALRAQVFVVEQACAYLDPDGKDLLAQHLLVWEGEELVASLRLLPQGISYSEASIGRVLVKESHRHQGLARQMMERAIELLRSDGKKGGIRIGAQTYLVDFYRSLGFQVSSEPYLEDGISHVEMAWSS